MKFVLTCRCWFLILCTSTLAGCSHLYYSPNAQNIPMFKKKGESVVCLAGGSGLHEVDFSFDVQTGYALTDNLGVMANYYRAAGKNTYNNYNYKEAGKGNLAEAGIGYFAPLPNKAFTFELYGGSGIGKVHNYYDEFKENFSELTFKRHFVQTAVGWQLDFIRIALSTRCGLLTYTKLQGSNLGKVTFPDYLDGVTRHKDYLLIEPALTAQIGDRAVKGHFQLVYSANHTDPEFKQEPININLGLHFTIPSLHNR